MSTKFADRLKFVMAKRSMMSNELERRAGLSKGYASRLRRGRAEMPTVPILRKIAAALGANLEFLMDDEATGPALLEEVKPPIQVIPIALLEEALQRRPPDVELVGPLTQGNRRGWAESMLRAIEEENVPGWAAAAARNLPWDGADSEDAITVQEVEELARKVVKLKKLTEQERIEADTIARRLRRKMKRPKKIKPPASNSKS